MITKYRALLVEDNPGDVRLVQQMLSGEISVRLDLECVATLQEAMKRLEEDSLDAVLVDLGLPDSQGLETFTALHNRFPHLPTIVVTGNADAQLGMRAVQAGAQDYLVKAEMTASPLVRSVQYAIERKRTEEALRASERRYRSIVETTQEGIWIIDAESRTSFVNARMAEMVGVTIAEMIGTSLFDFMDEEGVAAAKANVGRRRIGIREEHDFKLVRRDGRPVWTIMSTSPLTDEDGNYTGALAVVTDITERKANEEELLRLQQQLATELQKQVEERTAELRRRTEELEAAKLKLEETNRDLEAFTYSVSHDLRAPLRTLDGFSRLLSDNFDKQLGPTAADYLARIRNAAARMSELINDMLSLSRVGRLEMRASDVDLSTLVRSICDDLHQRDPSRKVDFLVTEHVTGRGDAALLRILLENLLENAWKFTSKHPTAKIEFGAEQREGQSVYFVRDDGAGFDPRYKDKMFVPFQRLHTVSEFEGTGIGLATVQRIVKRHGGTLRAEGDVERGAAFYFTLSAPQGANA